MATRQLTDSEQQAYLDAWTEYHESEPRAGDTIGERWAFEAAYIASLRHRQEEIAALTAENATLQMEIEAANIAAGEWEETAAALTAERTQLRAECKAHAEASDALREALEPFAKVGELIKPLELIAATSTYLWKQDSTTQADQFGITLADCIAAWRAWVTQLN